ncbi:MAG: N,N-dimethylformamidase beta subunit family domain-containing protein [Acidimicrobiales bacterium]
MSQEPLGRRSFLKGLGALAGATALGGCTSESAKPAGHSHPVSHRSHLEGVASGPVHFNEVGLPIADWVVKENQREGTTAWLVTGTPPHGLEGYLSQVSAQPGDELTLFVNSSARTLNIKAYRMGWYQGKGARLVADLGTAPARVQVPPTFTPGINMIECHWKPTMKVGIGKDWPPGYYLLRIGTDRGWSQWVPLLVRDDSSRAHIVVQSSVTTWQAYSLWGGYSLYYGKAQGGQSFANRSRVVSFDRPYAPGNEDGSADFFGNEYPLVALVEKLGLDVTYWTDIDLHARPELLANHRCLVSLGHDEYWSSRMRYGVQGAVNRGLNFAVLGANACYRHIRLAPSPLGEYRHEICYKVGPEDPLYGKNNAEVTSNWNAPPDPRPESALIGIMYQAYGASGSLVVVDSSHFAFKGTGLKDTSTVPDILGSEFDRYVPGPPSPTGVQILCHSPTNSVLGRLTSDMSYYTVKGGGGVFATGTASFVDRLWANSGILPTPFAPDPVPGCTDEVTRITENVLAAFAGGPASVSHPAQENWQHFYPSGSSAPPPVDSGTTS